MQNSGQSAIGETIQAAISMAAVVSRRERSRATVSLKNGRTISPQIEKLAERIVTSADLSTQEAVLRVFLKAGYSHAIIEAEETTPSLGLFHPRGMYPKIFIDPIDGTLAFSAVCSDWKQVLLGAGYDLALLNRVQHTWNLSLYGPIIAASVDNSNCPTAACALPELGVTYTLCEHRLLCNGREIRYDLEAISLAPCRRSVPP